MSEFLSRVTDRHPDVLSREAKRTYGREKITMDSLEELDSGNSEEADIKKAFQKLRGGARARAAYRILREVNKLLDFHGVESYSLGDDEDYNSDEFLYLNSGDMYSPTIVWDPSEEEFYITTLGDVREFYERDSAVITAAQSDGWGPASDGKVYNVGFASPQASNFNTGPWVTGSIRGVRGSGFAVEMSKSAYNRVVSSIRRKAGKDFNEANKMMYDHFSKLRDAAPYDPNTGSGPWDSAVTAAGRTPLWSKKGWEITWKEESKKWRGFYITGDGVGDGPTIYSVKPYKVGFDRPEVIPSFVKSALKQLAVKHESDLEHESDRKATFQDKLAMAHPDLARKAGRGLPSVLVKFRNPAYNYTTSVSKQTDEAAARRYFVGQEFNVGKGGKDQMEKVVDIEYTPASRAGAAPAYSFEGTRWLDGGQNTYHKAYLYKDGKLLDQSDVTYGYGNEYARTALKLAKKLGLVPADTRVLFRAGWQDNGAKNVSRKKDL